jgi:excisionase family DNA binding protein
MGDFPDEDRQADPLDALLTAAAVARLLDVPTGWVYEQSRRGAIPTVALGRYRRFRRDAILRWIEDREAAA